MSGRRARWIQRRRTRVCRMPQRTVYVGRSTKWGNPHLGSTPGLVRERYLDVLHRGELGFTVNGIRLELSGRNLACWCADVFGQL